MGLTGGLSSSLTTLNHRVYIPRDQQENFSSISFFCRWALLLVVLSSGCECCWSSISMDVSDTDHCRRMQDGVRSGGPACVFCCWGACSRCF